MRVIAIRCAVRIGEATHGSADNALQFNPAETDAGVGGGREERHGHPVAAVQADPGIASRAIQCLLLYHHPIKQAGRPVGKR